MKNISIPKKIVAVFAHPDDESFGCGGSLAYLSEKTHVELICVTSGDYYHDFEKGEKRKMELEDAAKILGIKKIHHLNFHDGDLSNHNYHEVADEVKKILEAIKPEAILTFEQTGVSGHLDHVAVSMISSFLFEKLEYIKKILYFCEKKEIKKIIGSDYFVYFPEGYEENEVDWVFDATDYLGTKIKAMKAHKSQIKDFEFITTLFKKHLNKEYYKIKSKT